MNKLLAKDSKEAAGMKVCRKVCWTYYQYSIELKWDPNFLGSLSKEDGLNQSLKAIGESALKVSKYSYDQRPSYLKAKQLKAAEAISNASLMKSKTMSHAKQKPLVLRLRTKPVIWIGW